MFIHAVVTVGSAPYDRCVGREIEALTELRAGLAQDDALDILEASSRARFDSSDEGKLIRRYELDLTRTLSRTIAQIDWTARSARSSSTVPGRRYVQLCGPTVDGVLIRSREPRTSWIKRSVSSLRDP